MYRQSIYDEKLLKDIGSSRITEDVDTGSYISEDLMRGSELKLPVLSELDVARHYTRLSEMSFGVESGFYPLGSCTMKYNPKLGKKLVAMQEFSDIHPYQPPETIQGTLEFMYWLEHILCVIGGMHAATLQPPAGALGEFTGLLIAKAYFEHIGENRTDVIVPDTAHGTNPASASMTGFNVVEVQSNEDGMVNIEKLKEVVSDKTSVFMLTNPNTLGIFEKNIKEISSIIHEAGALLYYDGANINPIIGITTPGKMGFDIIHFNLHKSFGTPHGGGGPGAGPVAVTKKLEPFLPVPRVVFEKGMYNLDYNYPLSIGKVSSCYGNTSVLYMAYIYILSNGKNGLIKRAIRSVVNSNYMKEKLMKHFELPFYKNRMHEFVLSLRDIKERRGIKASDFAKRLLDYGVHSPTIYFPLIVDEAFMIEPADTESVETMNAFIDAMLTILNEDPELIKGAPYNTSCSRVNEVEAAKSLTVSWKYIK
jgi:glycine dehydrogenase subunit 2